MTEFPDYNQPNKTDSVAGVKSDIVKLRGPKDDVDKCSKFLTKQVRDLQESNYQIKVS